MSSHSNGYIVIRWLAGVLVAIGVGTTAESAPLSISDSPLFLSANAEPLVMLAMSNDEQLYHKAYTDFDDVDGDGLLDTTYKDTINYYGYFDSAKCYSYSGTVSAGNFVPTAMAAGTNSHSCNSASGGGRWSGNFLNWASMARMDALRKVLYGGYRSTDSSTNTILERVNIPSDNHAWTKFYSANDLNQYTPYDITTYAAGVTLCNVTPLDGSNDLSQNNTISPRLRVAKGQWPDWGAQESKQWLWKSEFTPNASNPNASPNDAAGDKIDEFTVRVQACVSGLVGAEKCKTYGTSSKPVGLLQDFADADQLKMRFGLMTGSYGKRKSGGVLRKNVARFTDEVNSTNGTFTGVDGIVKSLNLMRISRYSYSQPGYSGTSPDNCPANQNSWSNGSCSNWGNPMGELYLETLRYFVGKTPNFSSDDTTWIANLKQATWVNPYGAASTSPNGGGAPVCAKPSVIAVSTGVVSFDNDEYGGTSDIPGLGGLSGANTETDTIGTNEGITGNKWYVGSLTGGAATDVCSSLTVNSLSAVTGICPEAAGLQGSYKIAGLASYAHKKTTALQTISGKNINPVDTFAIALAPPIPSIKVSVGGKTVTIIPVGYQWRNKNAMTLINFRVISQAADGSSGVFFMNYENAPAGSDYDNDEKGFLTYSVSGNNIKIAIYLTGSSAGATQDMGYIIDGVTDAGTYYLVSNQSMTATQEATGTPGGFFSTDITTIDIKCAAAGFAATPTSTSNEKCHYTLVGTDSPTAYDRNMRGVKTHTAGTPATSTLKSPLWYAAKWGGYKDLDGTGSLSSTSEWDSNGDGIPDTYFPVTNAGTLGAQLTTAFNEIIARVTSASSASVNSGSISNQSRVYQAKFNSRDWTGQLLAFAVNPSDGSLGTTPLWDAGAVGTLPAAAARHIITINSDGTKVPFEWANLDSTRKQQLDDATAAPWDTTLEQNRLNYLRGDATKEGTTTGMFRARPTKLGDIVDSSPVFVGPPAFNYSDSLETKPYSTYRTTNTSRTGVIYAGANDGMLHGFDAGTGSEVLGFIPGVVFGNLKYLTQQAYSHLFYVDGSPNMGDVFFGTNWHTVLVGGLNKGGQGIYALDITDPSNFTEVNADSLILWEFTNTKAAPYGDTELGYTYSQPAIIRLHDSGATKGKWAAIFGNGYNNASTGKAVLYIVDIETGALIRKITTGVGSVASPNGLATPAVVDLNGDSQADYVFAGDLQGNMWKFDIRDPDPTKWQVAYTDSSGNPAPLFQAKDASNNPQPITGRPEVGRGPHGSGMIILFGTGKFLETSDRTVTAGGPVQSFYGVIDSNNCSPGPGCSSSDVVSGRGVLQQQTITAEQSVTFGTSPNSATANIRVTSNTPIATAKGWYLDLVSPSGYQGERVVSNPILRNGHIIFTTLIPDPDPCSFGGNSWLMELDALSGSRLTTTPFDMNRDGKFDNSDLALITSGGTSSTLPVSGIQSEVGITPEPGILAGPNAEYKYSPGTSGNISITRENPGAGAFGRQSWRQIR